MRIAITGSTSSIGVRLIERLKENGHRTFALGGRGSRIWQLGDVFPQDLEVDVLIHLAHDRRLSLAQNIAAARILCDSFRGEKIFLSSFSAHSHSLSKYGKSKFEIEKIFAENKGWSLRAGVVYGVKIGGIFAQLETLLGMSRITPVPYRGLPTLLTSHIDDVISEIMSMLVRTSPNTVFAANSYPISLIELLKQISFSKGLKQSFVSLPRQPLDALLRVLVQIAPNFPMADSLLSLSKTVKNEELSNLQLPQTKFRAFNLQDSN